MSDDNLPEDIHSYVQYNLDPIPKEDLEDIILKVIAHSALSKDEAELIVPYFFEEIRSSVLNGEIVTIDGLGTFSVSTPAKNKNKERVFIKFKASKDTIRKLNDS